MQCVLAIFNRSTCAKQRGIGVETAINNGSIDAREILINEATSADIHVPDFGISHLSVWQSDVQTMRVHERMRIGREQLAPVRTVRLRDRIILRIVALAPAVKDQQ